MGTKDITEKILEDYNDVLRILPMYFCFKGRNELNLTI